MFRKWIYPSPSTYALPNVGDSLRIIMMNIITNTKTSHFQFYHLDPRILNCVGISYKYFTTHNKHCSAKFQADTNLTETPSKDGDFSEKSNNSCAGMIFEDLTIYTLVLNNVLYSSMTNFGIDASFLDKPFESINFVNLKDCLESVRTYHNDKIKHMGIVGGTKFYNSVRDYAITLLETDKEGHDSIPNPGNISTGRKDRWPSAFKDLRFLFRWQRSHIQGSDIADRLIRCLLSINRIKSDNSEIDTSSITDAGTSMPTSFIGDFKRFLKKFLKPVVKTSSVQWTIVPFLKTGKSGPSGKDSVESAGLEAGLLTHLDSWNDHFEPLCKLTGNSSFYTYVKELGRNSLLEELGSPERCNSQKLRNELGKGKLRKIYLRKLTPIPDKGNKSRVIAMSDKFTQHLLSGFEDEVLKVMKQLFRKECDYYSHKAGFEKLQKRLKANVNSYDLTSWTDRLPASLQVMVVEELFGSKIAEHWESLVVKCPWKLGAQQKMIKYSVGQGMGTRGSFQIASLTSMLLIKYIYVTKYGEKLSQFKYPRSAVGDDLFAFDPKGAIPELFKVLGVPVNLKKSKIATENNLVCEYVSRNINYGLDVSRISAKLCLSIRDNLLAVKSLLLHLEERGAIINVTRLFRDLMSLTRQSGSSRFKPWEFTMFWKSLICHKVLYDDTHSLVLASALKCFLQEETLLNEEEIEFYHLVTDSEEYWYCLLSSSILESKRAIDAISNEIDIPDSELSDMDLAIVNWYVSKSTSDKSIPSFCWESLDPSKSYGEIILKLREARLKCTTRLSFEIGAGLNTTFFDRELHSYRNSSIGEDAFNSIFSKYMRTLVKELEDVTKEFGLIPNSEEIHEGVPKFRLQHALKVATSYEDLSDLQSFYVKFSFQKKMITDDVIKHYCLTVEERIDPVSQEQIPELTEDSSAP